MATRLDPQIRKQSILDAALTVARKKHYYKMLRSDVAKAANITASLVRHYFGDMDDLRDAVIAEAVKREDLILIAQGLTMGHPRTRRIPEALKARARSAV